MAQAREKQATDGPRCYSRRQMLEKIRLADRSYLRWRNLDGKTRSQLVGQLAGVLLSRQEELAQAMTADMGKPIRQARSEIKKSVGLCEYYGERLQAEERQHYKTVCGVTHLIEKKSLGVILGVMPWNFPIWQATRFAIPTLLVGNSVLLRPSSLTWRTLGMLEDCFEAAGFPEGVFGCLYLEHSQIPDVLASRYVKGLSFTGSTSVGKELAALAGENMKKGVYELGGSDPYIVLDDANLTDAVRACVDSRFVNSGQSCIAAKRFIVEKNIYEKFVYEFINLCEKKVIGDPFGEFTDIGPLAKRSGAAKVEAQVEKSLQLGAKLVYSKGAGRLIGNYSPLMVVMEAPSNSPLFREEVFGPVAAIRPVEDAEEAIRLANQSRFGLGGAVFSQNPQRAQTIADRLDAGMVAINSYVKSHWELPFGGVKESGFGRELGGCGLDSFINTKVVANI